MQVLLLTLMLVLSGCVGTAGSGAKSESAKDSAVMSQAVLQQSGKDKQQNEIRLVIWDETDDRELGNRERYEGDTVRFFAFYGVRRKPIRDPSITCVIRSEVGEAPMKFNETLGLYTFERKARRSGTFSWSVRCGGGEYPERTEKDELVVLPLQEDLYRQILRFREVYDYENDPARRKKPGAFPRLINRFNVTKKYLDTDYKGLNLQRELAIALSKWDVVVPQLYNIRKFSLETHLQIHHLIKEKNPRTKLLMYIPGGSFPRRGQGLFSEDINRMLRENNWFVRTPEGSIFPPVDGWGIIQYSLDAPAARYASYIAAKIREYPYFDGVWLDLMRGERVIRKWFEEKKYAIDLDRDGIDDVKQHGADWVVDKLHSGYAAFLKELRKELGDGKIIVGNPGVPWEVNAKYDDSEMFKYANGNMKEGAEHTAYVLSTGIEGALLNEKLAYSKPERMFVISLQNRNPDLLDRDKMRYGLTMTLMTNAYYSYDSNEVEDGGHRHHNQIYWWPEYNVNLGFPVSDFTIRKGMKGENYYFREFDNGIVVCNSGKKAVMVRLEEKYQDLSTGNTSSTFTIVPQDGRILLPSDDD